MSDSELFDRSILDGFRKFGQAEFIASMVDLFFRSTDSAPDEISNFVAKRDWKEVAFAAHSLRSGAGNLGLVRLTDLSGDLEAAAKKADVAKVQELAKEIPGLYVQSCEALNDYLAKG